MESSTSTEVTEEAVEPKVPNFEQGLILPYVKRLVYLLCIIAVLNVVLYVLLRSFKPLFVLDMVALCGLFAFFARIISDVGVRERALIASEMGFDFAAIGDSTEIHELLRNFGEDPRVANVFSGIIAAYPAQIFELTYTWSEDASHTASMLGVTHDGVCPPMLILSKNDMLGETIDPSTLFPSVSMILEGDFNEHFSLFAAEGAEQVIRLLLAPDIVTTLISAMPNFSFLFVDQVLYVIFPSSGDEGFVKERFTDDIQKATAVIANWSPSLRLMSE